MQYSFQSVDLFFGVVFSFDNYKVCCQSERLERLLFLYRWKCLTSWQPQVLKPVVYFPKGISCLDQITSGLWHLLRLKIGSKCKFKYLLWSLSISILSFLATSNHISTWRHLLHLGSFNGKRKQSEDRKTNKNKIPIG